MLKIKVNNAFLDLQNASITFELQSPIFNNIGSFSYPFSLPATANNKALLGYPGRIHTSAAPHRIDNAEIIINGSVWKRGALQVKDATDKQIKAYFMVGEGYFYNRAKDVYPDNINMGGLRDMQQHINTSDQSVFMDVYDKLYPENDFTLFPFYMPEFPKDTWLYDSWDMPPQNSNVNLWYQNKYPYVTSQMTVLFPFLQYVMNAFADKLNLHVGINDLFNDPDLRQLVIFRNLAAVFYPPTLIDFWPAPTYNLADGMPNVNFIDLLKHLEQLFLAYTFYNDQTEQLDVILFKNIINNSNVIELDQPYKIVKKNINDWEGYTMDYGIDGGDELIKEHIKDIGMFNLKGEVNFQWQLPTSENEPFDLYFVNIERRYYYWEKTLSTYNPDGSWQYYASDLSSYGSGKEKITIPGIFARKHYSAGAGNTGQWYTLGESLLQRPEPVNLRLMFWHGLQDGVPFGSPFGINNNGQKIAPYSLEWEGPLGIRNQFYTEWLDFKASTHATELTMPLTFAELKQIDFSKKYMIAGQNWLIDKVKFTITNNQITPARITAWKV